MSSNEILIEMKKNKFGNKAKAMANNFYLIQ
jgi:hypothetical protein